MARTSQSPAAPPAADPDEWLTLAEARAILDVMSEDVVRAWSVKYGWLRGRTNPDGSLVVLKADVLNEKDIRDDLGAIGGHDMTEDELETLRQARPGTFPWEREQKASSAA